MTGVQTCALPIWKFLQSLQEVTYYYEQKEVPLIVHHYIEGTIVPVPLVNGEEAQDITDKGEEGNSYTTSAISKEELNENYELVEIPENRQGIYEYSGVEVTYYYRLAERKLLINKVDEDGTTPLQGAKFEIKELDEREVPIGAIGTIENNGMEYSILDKSKKVEGVIGEITKVENSEYYFEQNEDGTLTPNNIGIDDSVASSYIPIDLRSYEGNAQVVINIKVSSEENYDYGYASIEENIIDPINDGLSQEFMNVSGIYDK